MSLSLVTITHPVDPNAEVPFVGGRCPLNSVVVETWKVRHIEAMGFGVEVHEEPHDPIAASDKKADELAKALAEAAPAPAAPAPKAPEKAPAAPEAKAEPVSAPAAEQPAPAAAPAQSPASSESAEGGEEEEGLSEEELAALRARVEALATKADADALIAEYGIELNPMPSKLKDIKAQLLALIDAPAE
jgi:hypothetical protein